MNTNRKSMPVAYIGMWYTFFRFLFMDIAGAFIGFAIGAILAAIDALMITCGQPVKEVNGNGRTE